MSEHTPITGELRDTLERGKCTFTNSAGFEQVNVTKDALDSMLDAIDAVHAGLERENAELRERVAELDKRDDSMHIGWMRLPVAADGETIHVGDVMEWPTTGETFEVVGIGDGTLFYVEDGNECADWTGASTKRHHHAPTVEDVLREMLDAWGELPSNATNEAIVAEYAAKLRLAGDAE